tara:strand:- start:1468 stop:1671 length:204 start_codon:yes stop_codon:yes gene_type:complete
MNHTRTIINIKFDIYNYNILKMYIHNLLLKNYIICRNYEKIYQEKIKCKKNYNIFINYLNFKGYYLK